jgi:hypothetical protein
MIKSIVISPCASMHLGFLRKPYTHPLFLQLTGWHRTSCDHLRKCVSHASNSQDINVQSLHNVRASPICCNRAKTATVQKRTGARPTHVRTLYVTYSVCTPSVQSANPTPRGSRAHQETYTRAMCTPKDVMLALWHTKRRSTWVTRSSLVM